MLLSQCYMNHTITVISLSTQDNFTVTTTDVVESETLTSFIANVKLATEKMFGDLSKHFDEMS